MMKALKYLLLGVIVILLISLTMFYKSDIPAATIKADYSLSHSQFVDIKGMNIHYCMEGQGDTLVLLHGTGSSLHTWQDWVDHLKDSFTIVRMDMPGFGLTGPHPQHDYTAAAYMDVFDGLFDHLKLNQFHIGGNSFGGFLAWNYALHKPGNVESLILVDAAGYPMPEGSQMPIGFRIAKNKILAPIMEHITPFNVIEKTVYQSYEKEDVVTDEVMKRYSDLLLREGNRKAIAKRIQQIEPELISKIPDIKTPTLILWGKEDALLPVSMAYRFEEDLDNETLIIYDGVGHIPMEEIPDQTVQDLKAFISSVKKQGHDL